ncbi:PEGA domain-containing protein, partial [Myxococcota bacterium]|nr:PEGA domain-containing protein [Myxococcota bacterium]
APPPPRLGGPQPSFAEPFSLDQIGALGKSATAPRTSYSVSDDLFTVGPPAPSAPQAGVILGAPDPAQLLDVDDLRIKKHRSVMGLVWAVAILVGVGALGWVMYHNYLNPKERGNPNLQVAPPRFQDLAKGPDDLPPVAPAKRALVRLESEPSGARVVLNGNPLAALTPTAAQTYADQWVEVTMSAPGYLPATRRLRLEGDEGKVHMTLSKGRPETGSLRVESDPEGAAVILNGETLGFTPVSLPKLAAEQQHAFLIMKDDHYPHMLLYTLAAGEEMDVIVRLAPARGARAQAQISVQSRPLGAEITQALMSEQPKIKGKTSRFPLLLNAPMNTQTRLKAIKADHDSAEAIIDVEKAHYTLYLKLTPPKVEYGYLNLSGPKELQAFVGKGEVALPSRRHTLPVGVHELITFSPDSDARATFKIEIRKGKTLKHRLSLKDNTIQLH